MRLITSLIIASVAGSVLVGGLKSYVDQPDAMPARTVLALYRKDDATTALLIHQATFICVPELNKLKTSRARNLLPRIFLLTLIAAQDGKEQMTDQQKNDLIVKEIAPVLAHAPQDEVSLLGKVLKQAKNKGPKLVGCITQTIVKLSPERERSDPKARLSDVKFRGTWIPLRPTVDYPCPTPRYFCTNDGSAFTSATVASA